MHCLPYLYKSCPVRVCGFALLRVEDTLPAACALPADCAKPTISLELSAKPTILGSWRPRRPADGPPGAQDGLRRASWRPRRPPDGPPGAQDGLPTGLLATGLLAPKTASRRASWRPRRPSDGPPGARNALDACAVRTLPPGFPDNCLDETSVR